MTFSPGVVLSTPRASTKGSISTSTLLKQYFSLFWFKRRFQLSLDSQEFETYRAHEFFFSTKLKKVIKWWKRGSKPKIGSGDEATHRVIRENDKNKFYDRNKKSRIFPMVTAYDRSVVDVIKLTHLDAGVGIFIAHCCCNAELVFSPPQLQFTTNFISKVMALSDLSMFLSAMNLV